MRKLRIILSAVVIAVMIILLGVPLGAGFWAQKRYPQMISQLNTPHVSFALQSFKRGWFHSQAQLQVTFHSAEKTLNGDNIPLARVIIHQNIQHGPLVQAKDLNGRRHWMIMRAAIYNESQTDNANLKATELWSMGNTVHIDLNVAHLLLGNDRHRIEINGLTGNMAFTPADAHFKSQLTLDHGTLYGKNPEKVDEIIDLVKVMALDRFVTTLDIHKIKTLWYGNRHFSAEKVQLFPYAGEILTIDELRTDFNQNQHDQLTDFHIVNQASAISSEQFKMNQLQIALNLKDINTQLLEDFVHVVMYGPDFQRLQWYSLLIDLLNKGMVLDLSQMQFTTPEGPVSVQAQINSQATEKISVQAFAQVPKEWLKNTLAAYYDVKKSENPHLQVNPQVLAGQYVDHWLAHRLLVPNGQQVTMTLVYQKNRLLVNGEKPDWDSFVVNNTLPGIR